MWFAYMDEAGNTGRDLANPEQTFHMIVTVVFDESRVPAVHEHVKDVGRRHCAADWLRPDFEFHGYDIFSGNGYFAGKTPADRIQVYDDLLKGIGALGGKVTARGVDKPGLARRYPHPFHPHDITLMFTCESLERQGRKHDSRILLVADEARDVEDSALRDLASYQQFGTSWGWQAEQIDHIIDTIHFVRSETNPAIQLADCTAFMVARQRKINRGEVQANPAVTTLWENHILPHMWANEIWYPG
jgi:hypothetical protein